jgi:hypothetical protein
VGAVFGGDNRRVGGKSWGETRPMFDELWQGSATQWTEARSEQLFAGIMSKLDTRRRRRRTMRLAITCAGVAVTILVGLGLMGIGVNTPFAHLLSRVHAGWFTTT